MNEQKATGIIEVATVKNWNGQDKISFMVGGKWFGAYLGKMAPDTQEYVKGFRKGDEVEIDYEAKDSSSGGTYNELRGILKVVRPDGQTPPPANVQPVGHGTLTPAKKPWGGRPAAPAEDPEQKARSMALSYAKDWHVEKLTHPPEEFKGDQVWSDDEVLATAAKFAAFIIGGK